MKKEAFVFALFLAVVFLAGCSHQEMPEKSSSMSFTEWSNSPPISYSLFNLKYSSQIKSAVYNNDEEKCNDVLDEERSRESIASFIECKHLLIKREAFEQKDYEICKGIYDENDKEEYEECTAPIVAYSAITLKDKNYCQDYLTTGRLIELCEGDYETYI